MALAALIDLRSHRIPNWLSFGGAGISLSLSAALLGLEGLLMGLTGLCVGLIAFLPIYALGGMGAGDVKLMAAVGSFLGLHGAFLAALFSLIAGLFIALSIVVWRGALTELLQRWGDTLKLFFTTRVWLHQRPAADAVAAARFPYALAIGLGTLAFILCRQANGI